MLRGERITLRPIVADDLPTMREWFRDRALAATWARHPVAPENHLAGDLADRFSTFDREGHFAVLDESGTLIGRIDFDDLEPIDRTAELSILIGADHGRGRGYGADACHTLIQHLFDDRQIVRVWLSVLAWNAPAIRLYEKLGFVHEGTLKELIWLDGSWHDLLIMGLLKDEYQRPETNRFGV